MKPIEPARRIRDLPKYLFAEIDRKKKEVASRGVDIISLGIGDPDQPTPPHIVEALRDAARNPVNHRYPDYEGSLPLRTAVGKWYKDRFGVAVDPATEVVVLIGSKEGIAHLPHAYADRGDWVLVPDPGYPVYGIMSAMIGAQVHRMPLCEERAFLPDLGAIPGEIAASAKIMFLNYPNNPTGASAPREFFEEALAFCRERGILLALDCAYSEIHFGHDVYRSIFDLPGAREHAVEFHSLSKTYNMTGWRVGFAVGGAAVIDAMLKVKTNLDSGVFGAVQDAAVAALSGDQSCVERTRAIFAARRQRVAQALTRMGFRFRTPEGAFYFWVRVPEGRTSAQFCMQMLEKAGVVVTPGTGFGPSGEGYFRISLTCPDDRLDEALGRMQKFLA
ncbi:MAG: LL-diaminopimelate aminotransferase [Deltaproteobacteria bacterium]|nr:LL-diaminopimelate aminotransferase [Deltaproteobacteria bacterium]